MKMNLLLLREKNRLPLVLQTEMAECGLACLAMIAWFYGHKIDLNYLRRRHPTSLRGARLQDIMSVAAQLGLNSRPLRVELNYLQKLKAPAILHWDMRHYVVFKGALRDKIQIHDPAFGVRTLSLAEASLHFTGVALEIEPTARLERKKAAVETVSLSDLWSSLKGIKKTATHLVVLSVTLLLFSLLSPLFMQIVLDDVVVSQDAGLLVAAALGFAFIELVKAVISLLRSLVVSYVNNDIGYQLGANIYHHLLRLPLDFFQKRQLGDVMSRFQSIHTLKTLISENFVVFLVDGVLAIITFMMMLFYAPKLTLVTLIFLILYAVLRGFSYRAMRERQEEEIVAGARETTNFMESIRAIQGIKSFGRESARHSLWTNLFATRTNAGIRCESLRATINSGNMLLSGIETIAVVYVGASMVLNGGLTVGMLVAFMGYKAQFSSATVKLFEKIMELKMMDLHLTRLSDVLLAEPEQESDAPRSLHQIEGHVEASCLSFAYNAGEAPVIEEVQLEVLPGDSLAIFGASGCGKTTLIKVLAGLYTPSSGTIMIDGIDRQSIGLRTFREQTATLMQNDQLLSGSIAENIAFFETDIDFDWVIECAKIAHVHEDIVRMPMAYESLIGDMGTSLSAGQQQRILLARALYRRPKILFLDEATSHLDVPLERAVCDAIRQLKITRIFIAHRPDAIKSADVFAYMKAGRLQMVSRKEMLSLVTNRADNINSEKYYVN